MAALRIVRLRWVGAVVCGLTAVGPGGTSQGSHKIIDFLDQAGSYIYRLEASNAAGDSVYEDRFVTVTEAQ